MIPLYTREEMRAIDRAASERYGVPSLSLMESAGGGAAAYLRQHDGDRLSRVLVAGGEGQNGGDGWVVARHLLAAGERPSCLLVGRADRVRGDARVNLDALRALGVDVAACEDAELRELERRIASASLVVDALFGTGLSRPVEGAYARAVELINAAKVPVIALDLPSGIDANTGQVLGVAVRARATVTFAGHKRGLHQYPGVAHAGGVTCVGIGAPAASDGRVGLIEPCDLGSLLAADAGDAHKGTRGHVLAVAGSRGKTGAAILSALGALRAGAGLVTIAADAETQRVLEHKVLELMTAQIEDADPLSSVMTLAHGKRALLLGPGFGLSAKRLSLARALARELPLPCVLDADALTALEGQPEALQHARAPRVLTPHPGEASALLGRSTEAIQADRYAAARELAERSSHVAVLKGARTVIAAPDGRLRVCTAGTSALGVAGTGDVLCGVIAALCGRLPPFEAACAGVLLHATAGELAAVSDRGLFAGELADALPRALEQLRRAGSAGVRGTL